MFVDRSHAVSTMNLQPNARARFDGAGRGCVLDDPPSREEFPSHRSVDGTQARLEGTDESREVASGLWMKGRTGERADG